MDLLSGLPNTYQNRFPRPPSVNTCFATDFRTRRRFATKAYQDWKLESLHLGMAGKKTIKGLVKVTFRFGREKDKRRRDVNNYEKPLNDMLVELGILEDDCMIQDQRNLWTSSVPAGMVDVIVEEWKGED